MYSLLIQALSFMTAEPKIPWISSSKFVKISLPELFCSGSELQPILTKLTAFRYCLERTAFRLAFVPSIDMMAFVHKAKHPSGVNVTHSAQPRLQSGAPLNPLFRVSEGCKVAKVLKVHHLCTQLRFETICREKNSDLIGTLKASFFCMGNS